MKKTILLAATAAVLGSSLAVAAPNQNNNTQQGSLLVFPRIDVSDAKTTIVRISNNNGNLGVRVKCYWMDDGVDPVQAGGDDPYKDTRDFELRLTANEAVYINAKDGTTSFGNVPSFPDLNDNVGELLCWAVDETVLGGFRQKRHNFLSGTAEVIKYDTPESVSDGYEYSYKYSAAAFYGRAGLNANPGVMQLDPSVDGYDACGEFVVGHFSPKDAEIHLYDDVYARYVTNQMSWASCTQDLTAQGRAAWIDVTVNYTVYNADETPFTGAREPGDSWWQVYLERSPQEGLYDYYVDRNGQNFEYDELGTASAYFRANTAEGYGLTGVLVTKACVYQDGITANDSCPGDIVSHATNLNHAGLLSGEISWTPDNSFPEAK